MTVFSERVSLKPVAAAHARDVFFGFTEDTARYLAEKPADDIEGTEARISLVRDSMDRKVALAMSVIERASGRFLGCVGLTGADTDEPEAYVWIVESDRRKGYGSEALNALSGWVTENLPGKTVVCSVAMENAGGLAFVRSLGGTLVGSGVIRDSRGDGFPSSRFRLDALARS